MILCDTDAQPVADNTEELDTVVVTGTAVPEPLSGVTSSVTVVTEEEIRLIDADSVSGLLEHVPGLYVDQQGGRGGVSSVYIRGGDPNFALVLIDGVEVNDPNNARGGSFDFSTLSPDNIERIEIVRGAMSSLYGSDALSGVINIITKKGMGTPSLDFDISSGTYGQFRSLMRSGGADGTGDYSLSASYLDDGEPVEGSGFKSPAFTVNAGIMPSDDFELRLQARYAHLDSRSFPEDSGGPEFAVIRQTETTEGDQLSLGLDIGHAPVSWWSYSINSGFYYSGQRIDSPGVAPGERDPFGIPPNDSDSEFYRLDSRLLNSMDFGGGFKISTGLEIEYESGLNEGILSGEFPVSTTFRLSRYIASPFAEFRISAVPGLIITGGARADFPEDYGAEFTPRFGILYDFGPTDTTLRVNWGKGFKLPSFFALGNPVVGNPDLEPEKSTTFDLGLTQYFWNDLFQATLTCYYSEYKNLIDFDEGPPPLLVNRSRVTVKGFEANAVFSPLPSVKLTGDLTYANSDIDGTSEELRNRPEWWGGFTAYLKPADSVRVTLRGLFVGKVRDSSIPTGDVTLDPYRRFDLALNVKANENTVINFSVDNLFNEKYEQFVGFPAPGISARAGIRIDL